MSQSIWASTVAGLGSFLQENIDFPLHLISDTLRPPQVKNLSNILGDEGKIVRVNGERLAVYRDTQGQIHAVSPICTHFGCHISFNPEKKHGTVPATAHA